MNAGETIRVRGEGGAEFDVDVPPDGSVQRELLDDALDKGRLTIVEPEKPKAPKKPKGKSAEKVEKPVDSGDSVGEVGADVLVEEQSPEPEQVVDGPVAETGEGDAEQGDGA